jgi:BirA family biotin operon repressor/biotin-[acetyl-CoA-carboxylase] ligase
MVEREGEEKIAGILAEYVQQENPVLVVGMGLNIEWPLQKDPAPPDSTSLKACGVKKDRWEMLIEILKNFEKRLIEISSEKGTSTFRQAYTAKSSTLGNQVKVQKSDGDIVGNAVDIEEDGSLIVENENGTTSITAGDVIHLRKL